MPSCICGRNLANAAGLRAHQRKCPISFESERAAAKHENIVEEPVIPTTPPAIVAEAPPEVDAAEQISKALGDKIPDAIQFGRAKKKATGVTVFAGDPEDKEGDVAPVTPREDLDDLSKRLGAEFFRAGTENRFTWCREFEPDGPRHTFSRLYGKERVLVDIYPERNKRVEPEIAQKIAAIELHNANAPHDQWGYLCFVRGEELPTPEMVQRALAKQCVPLPPKPVEKLTLADTL